MTAKLYFNNYQMEVTEVIVKQEYFWAKDLANKWYKIPLNVLTVDKKEPKLSKRVKKDKLQNDPEGLTEEQREFLGKRIQQLRSKQKRVGPFKQYGIQRTIDGMKKQLKENRWDPPVKET